MHARKSGGLYKGAGQGKSYFPLETASIFQAKIEDLRLKCCILGKKLKNKRKDAFT